MWVELLVAWYHWVVVNLSLFSDTEQYIILFNIGQPDTPASTTLMLFTDSEV